jgi:hypothetical protein
MCVRARVVKSFCVALYLLDSRNLAAICLFFSVCNDGDSVLGIDFCLFDKNKNTACIVAHH